MKHRVKKVTVQWRLAGDDVTVEVSLGGAAAVMTPDLAEELRGKLGAHLGHIRRFKEQREAQKSD